MQKSTICKFICICEDFHILVDSLRFPTVIIVGEVAEWSKAQD